MGIVQGITEFFPVSSSGHLTVLPFIFSYTDPGLSFSIDLHAGTLMAIVWVFRFDWLKLARGILKKESSQIKLFTLLLLTSIPGALAGLFFEGMAETVFRNPAIVAFNLIVFGLLLYWVDKKVSNKLNLKALTYKNAFLIGLSQALAIIPGVSRSGATVTAARALGLRREVALRYSFLAAAPIILGATIYGLRKVDIANLLSPNWLVGFAVAAASSAWAMSFLLKYVKNNDFKIFLWWRIALAAVIIALLIMGG